MCGIAGFISTREDAPVGEREELLDRMCRLIAYRGPDEQGMVVKGQAALGMRRLAIIDLRSGQQPIYSEDRNLAIVFNGEIYNYRELKKELEALGHRFKTNSDTETIVRAYEEFGEDCLKKLRGMFAFAIWNERERTLFLARDRVGKKPLFFSLTKNGNFVFGSEIKTLLLHNDVKRDMDLAALDSFITLGYVPEEQCIFSGIQKLKPGHLLIFRNGSANIKQYWDFEFGDNGEALSEEEYITGLRSKIDDAVNVRLISEVPLGAFLSGGVDSSTIVASMARHSTSPVKTFSIGFNEDSFDELKFARIAAREFGTEHHEFIVTPDLVEIAEDLVWHFDEPFSDPSSLPTYMVSKMAREFVTVVLSGDGGDELFAGYSRYATHKRRNGFNIVPAAIRRGLFGRIGKLLPHGAPGKNYLHNISLDPVDRYIDSVSHFNRLQRGYLYSDDFLAKLDGNFAFAEDLLNSIANVSTNGDSVDQLLYLDSKSYLPGDILTKVDRMSMANSLEARSPFLDHELIEYAARIPATLKLNGTETKYILKKAMSGIVPDKILYREKQGFGVPIVEWINTQLRSRIRDTLLDAKTLQRGYFNRSYLEKLLAEHSSRRRDHSYELWGLYMLELWHRRYMDR